MEEEPARLLVVILEGHFTGFLHFYVTGMLVNLQLRISKKEMTSVSVCLFVYGYPFSSSGWRYDMNGNLGSCRQPN